MVFEGTKTQKFGVFLPAAGEKFWPILAYEDLCEKVSLLGKILDFFEFATPVVFPNVFVMLKVIFSQTT